MLLWRPSGEAASAGSAVKPVCIVRTDRCPFRNDYTFDCGATSHVTPSRAAAREVATGRPPPTRTTPLRPLALGSLFFSLHNWWTQDRSLVHQGKRGESIVPFSGAGGPTVRHTRLSTCWCLSSLTSVPLSSCMSHSLHGSPAHAYHLKRALARITMICLPLCCVGRQSSNLETKAGIKRERQR